MDWIVMLISTLALATVFGIGYLVYRLYKRAKNSTKDLANKAAVPLAIASRFTKLRSYTMISPAGIAKDGKFADIDFLIIGYFGVLGVKSIGLGGEIYGSSDDAMWLQVSSGKRISFENPLRVAQSDARLVRDTLFAAGLKNVSVEVICVCTNKKATLALPRTTGHYTIKDFKRYLTREKFEQDKGIDISCVKAAIEKYVSAANS